MPGLGHGLAFAINGQRYKAEEILERYQQKPRESAELMVMAKLLNTLGRTESAVNCIAEAKMQQGPYFPYDLMSRHLANLRDHPRVRTFIQQLGPPTE